MCVILGNDVLITEEEFVIMSLQVENLEHNMAKLTIEAECADPVVIEFTVG